MTKREVVWRIIQNNADLSRRALDIVGKRLIRECGYDVMDRAVDSLYEEIIHNRELWSEKDLQELERSELEDLQNGR